MNEEHGIIIENGMLKELYDTYDYHQVQVEIKTGMSCRGTTNTISMQK